MKWTAQPGAVSGRGGRGAPLPGHRGFTLVELLVALLIATLIISIIPPLFTGSIASTETRAAVRKLATGLRHARSQAIATQQQTTLTLDLEQRRFRTSGRPGEIALARDLALTLTTADSEVETQELGSIRFFPDGSSTGGRIKVGDGSRQFVLDVDWLTGRVALHE